jgi:hypothetical protein
MARRLALERDGGSLEGCRGWPFDGLPRLFGAMPYLPPWVVATRGVVCGCRLVHLLLLCLENSDFPCY